MELLEKSFDLFLERKVERGMELGRAQGATEKAMEIAKNFLSLGTPLEIVTKASGLPLDIVEGLVD